MAKMRMAMGMRIFAMVSSMTAEAPLREDISSGLDNDKDDDGGGSEARRGSVVGAMAKKKPSPPRRQLA